MNEPTIEEIVYEYKSLLDLEKIYLNKKKSFEEKIKKLIGGKT